MKSDIGSGIVTTPFLNYKSGIRTKPTTGKALALIREPYFNRTYGHYSSHANTPYQLEDSAFPAVIRNDNVIFFAHALDRLYNANGVRFHRDLFRNALDLVDLAPVMQVTGLPSSGRVSFLQQSAKNRYVAHLFYSPPLQRGDCKVIDYFPPIPGVILEIRVPEKITNVRTIPVAGKLSFEQKDGMVKVTVPTFTMHTAVVLEY